jgi:DNA-directed RNA polymerase specialized sigma24 family protein
VKKQNEISGSYANAMLVDDDQANRNGHSFHDLFPNESPSGELATLEDPEELTLLFQRITQLPLATKKILAMYYHERLPVSGIAACFNLPTRRIEEILTRTVHSLRNA